MCYNFYMSKEEIRKKYLELRKSIIDRDIKSKIIFNKIINSIDFKDSKVIALYKSLKYETDTDELIDYALKLNKIVLLPRVEKSEMFFHSYSLEDELIKSNFGVLEPSNKSIIYSKSDIDLIIVPGVSFDIKRNRMGYGKGYYDKYLSNTNIDTIGICFDEQVIDLLPVSDNDIKMKKILTDKRII